MKERRQPHKQTKGNSSQRNSPQSVSTKGLKAFALSHLDSKHPLRVVLLAERDILTVEEFCAKMETWTVLLNNKN
jgi:hypothetical protein